MNLIERAKAPTPRFFRILRNVGLALAAAGAAILAAPIGLPAAIVTLGGYLTVGGAILSAVSQITVEGDISSETSQSNGKSS
jgi:ABC-type xylose transport system permease subunit